MLRLTVLGSGSRGNAFLVEGQHSSVLVDAGFSPRALARRLAQVNRRPENIQHLILTHEHTDHASGALDACARWGWTLCGTAGTLAALPDAIVPTMRITSNSGCVVGGFAVHATPIPHDATEPVALVLTERVSGARVGIATDVGHVTDALVSAFEKLDILVIESNHDEQMLANGPYPWSLKQRVSGKFGHLSNGEAAGFVARCAHRGLRGVVLAHLSETNNTPEAATLRSRLALQKAGWKRDSLWAAHQAQICGPLSPAHGMTSARAVQLGFEL